MRRGRETGAATLSGWMGGCGDGRGVWFGGGGGSAEARGALRLSSEKRAELQHRERGPHLVARVRAYAVCARSRVLDVC